MCIAAKHSLKATGIIKLFNNLGLIVNLILGDEGKYHLMTGFMNPPGRHEPLSSCEKKSEIWRLIVAELLNFPDLSTNCILPYGSRKLQQTPPSSQMMIWNYQARAN